jgi:hypothetical protein
MYFIGATGKMQDSFMLEHIADSLDLIQKSIAALQTYGFDFFMRVSAMSKVCIRLLMLQSIRFFLVVELGREIFLSVAQLIKFILS